MEIYSVRSPTSLSKQTAGIIRDLVLRANGPIVLPLSSRDIAYFRTEAQNPEVVRAFQNSPFTLAIWMIAILALSRNKIVLPFYTSDFNRLNKKYGQIELGAERLLDVTNDRDLVNAFRRRGIAHVSAEQMVALWSRWRITKPALVIAEDNFAHVLGRLLRVKVHRLTRDDPQTPNFVRRTMREIPYVFRTKTKRKHGKK